MPSSTSQSRTVWTTHTHARHNTFHVWPSAHHEHPPVPSKDDVTSRFELFGWSCTPVTRSLCPINWCSCSPVSADTTRTTLPDAKNVNLECHTQAQGYKHNKGEHHAANACTHLDLLEKEDGRHERLPPQTLITDMLRVAQTHTRPAKCESSRQVVRTSVALLRFAYTAPNIPSKPTLYPNETSDRTQTGGFSWGVRGLAAADNQPPLLCEDHRQQNSTISPHHTDILPWA